VLDMQRVAGALQRVGQAQAAHRSPKPWRTSTPAISHAQNLVEDQAAPRRA
jgi:hypothetical protein